jgi:hypothetical protein
MFTRKRGLTCQHFIHENSNAPAIDFIVVSLPAGDFWRKIVKSPTKSASRSLRDDRPTKIGNFKIVAETNDILRFDVSMHDSKTMKICHSRSNLLKIKGSCGLIKRS